MDQGEREACIRETVVVGGPRSSWIVEMIPLILYGESPKNPTAGTKAELDRPGTPSYRRYFIYRTKTASPSFPPLPLAPPLDPLARSKGGIRINIRRWRMKLQPTLSAVFFLSSSFPFLVASAPLDDASSPARKQMSDDHPVHSQRHNGKRATTWNDSTTSYVLDNAPLRNCFLRFDYLSIFTQRRFHFFLSRFFFNSLILFRVYLKSRERRKVEIFLSINNLTPFSNHAAL